MIRIKAVDSQNISAVCALTCGGDAVPAPDGRLCCNALSIAQSRFDPELHPNAIYSGSVPVGFFMYKRSETQADTAVIRRFMLGGRRRERGLEKKALEHVLKGLKLQGVKKVLITAGAAREDPAELFLSLGFRPAGEGGCDGLCYELKM